MSEDIKKGIFDRQRSARMSKELCDFIGKSLISEIECPSCKYKNKTKDDWSLRFGKDVCSECGEELPLEAIYGGPPKDYIDFILNDEEPECNKITRMYVEEKPKKKIKKPSTLLNPEVYIDPITSIPDPINEGLKNFIKEIEKRAEERQKNPTKKSIYEDPESGWGDKEF